MIMTGLRLEFNNALLTIPLVRALLYPSVFSPLEVIWSPKLNDKYYYKGRVRLSFCMSKKKSTLLVSLDVEL